MAFSCWKRRNSVKHNARKRVPRRSICSRRKQYSSATGNSNTQQEPKKAAPALMWYDSNCALHHTEYCFPHLLQLSCCQRTSYKYWGKQMCYPCSTTGSSNYSSTSYLSRLTALCRYDWGVPLSAFPMHLHYLHNSRFQLLHWFWLFVLHCGTHHLFLHHAVLMQCSLVLVQYPLLMSFTQVLYRGKETNKKQVLSGSRAWC